MDVPNHKPDRQADYGDARREYEAARTSAALFDRSNAGKIEVSGPEAPDFLHNLSTNDVKGLALGAGCEAFFCNPRARTLFHGHIYHLQTDGRHALWIDVTPGYNEALLKHLDRHLIAEQVELSDRTADFAQFHLAGPGAENVLATAIGAPIPELALHEHMERNIGAHAAQIRRHDPLGVRGFDIVVPNSQAAVVWDRLAAAGATPAGQTAWEWLRVEAGTPEYGRDIDEQRFVVEVGRTDAISFTKGCYLGQEPIVMARDRAGFVNRSLGRVQLSAMARPGQKLFDRGEAGLITSVADTPGCGPIALAYLQRGFAEPGRQLRVGAVDGPTIATVMAKPSAPPTG